MTDHPPSGSLEKSSGLNAWGNSTPIYDSVLRLFMSELPKDLARLQVASTASNLVDVQHIAHSISGMALSVGAIQLNILASALENACELSRFPQINALINLLSQEHEQLFKELAVHSLSS